MQKKEIITFSIFGILLSIASFAKNFIIARMFALGEPYNNKIIPDKLADQIHGMDKYQILAERISYVLFFFLLLYIGWKVAYAFIKIRYILLAECIVLLIPALIEFAFVPRDKSAWLFLGLNLFNSVIWICILKVYYIASEKAKLKIRKKALTNTEMIIFSVLTICTVPFSFLKASAHARENALSDPYLNNSIPPDVYKQIESASQEQSMPYKVITVIFAVFLLYIGWKTAYGFIKTRYIIPIALVFVLVPNLIEYFLVPMDRTLWQVMFRQFYNTAGWILLMSVYCFAAKMVQLKKINEVNVS